MTILLCFALYTALCRRRGSIYVVVVSSEERTSWYDSECSLIEHVKFWIA